MTLPKAELPQRKNIRLPKFHYFAGYWYFVSICTKDKKHLFGEVCIASVGATRGSPETQLSDVGKIVSDVWLSLPKHHYVELDVFTIMPNHVHFVIGMFSGGSRPAPTLGTVTGLFKSECSRRIRKLVNDPSLEVWQRGYYEHIIRNEKELNEIREYVIFNSYGWEGDEENKHS